MEYPLLEWYSSVPLLRIQKATVTVQDESSFLPTRIFCGSAYILNSFAKTFKIPKHYTDQQTPAQPKKLIQVITISMKILLLMYRKVEILKSGHIYVLKLLRETNGIRL